LLKIKKSQKSCAQRLLSRENGLKIEEMTKEFLEDLANEEDFKYSFIILPTPKTLSPPPSTTTTTKPLLLNRIMLHIKTSPDNVFHGTGDTLDEAIHQAVINCLEFIKIICTK
jgi:hypothetical protein